MYFKIYLKEINKWYQFIFATSNGLSIITCRVQTFLFLYFEFLNVVWQFCDFKNPIKPHKMHLHIKSFQQNRSVSKDKSLKIGCPKTKCKQTREISHKNFGWLIIHRSTIKRGRIHRICFEVFLTFFIIFKKYIFHLFAVNNYNEMVRANVFFYISTLSVNEILKKTNVKALYLTMMIVYRFFYLKWNLYKHNKFSFWVFS